MSDFKASLKSSSGRLVVNVIGQFINTLGQLGVVPLFLHYWTKLQYGEWLVLTAVPSLLWSIEGGFAGLAVNRMVLDSAVGDWKGANRLFQNIVVIQFLVSAIIILGGVIVEWGVNFRPFFCILEMSRHDANVILISMLFYMSFGWCVNLLRAPYFAAGCASRGYMMVNFWRLTDFFVVGTTLVLHGTGPSVALAQTSNAALWVALACLDITRKCPQFQFGLHDISWTAAKSVFRDGLPLFLGQAGHAFYLQGYPLVLGRTLGALAVVNFSAIRTVSRVFLQAIMICTNAAALELGKSYANKKWSVYLAWVKTLIASVILGALTACAALYFFGPSVIGFWTHGKVSVSGSMLLLFGVSVGLQAAWAVFYMLLYSSNQHHLQCYSAFGITIGALMLGDLTIGSFGFVSVPLLMISADLLILASAIYFCVRSIPNVRFGELWQIIGPWYYVEKAGWLFTKARTWRQLSLNR